MIELTNISVDNELTALRIKELMESASQEQRDVIHATAGLSDTSIHLIYTTGNINIMVTNLIARSFNVNPFYITGDVDDPGEFNDENLHAILTEKGYSFLIEELSEPESELRVHFHPALEEFLRNKNTDEPES